VSAQPGAPREPTALMGLRDPSLYVILDRSAAQDRDLEAILAATIAGGCRVVQLREKAWPSGTLLPLAGRLRDRCRRAGVTFIVNLPPLVARPLLRPGMILGVSTHGLEQARVAQRDGADYVAVGSMFATASKTGFELVGPALLRDVRRAIQVPLIGIGGVTEQNLVEVVRAGADGVAVLSAVCGAPDPEGVTRRMLGAIRAARAP
jgi:thiamine-phosphate pyrophosphorylase